MLDLSCVNVNVTGVYIMRRRNSTSADRNGKWIKH